MQVSVSYCFQAVLLTVPAESYSPGEAERRVSFLGIILISLMIAMRMRMRMKRIMIKISRMTASRRRGDGWGIP